MTADEIVTKALALSAAGTVDVLRPVEAAYLEPAYRLAQAEWPGLYESIRENVAQRMQTGGGDFRSTLLDLVEAGLIDGELQFLVVAALAQRASDELVSGN